MSSLIEQTLEVYRQRVLVQEAQEMALMAQRWLQVEQALEAQAILLAEQIAVEKAAGKVVSASKLYRMERYQKLLAQAKMETKKYSQWAAGVIAENQSNMAQLGIDAAASAIRATYWEGGVVGGYFDILPVEAIEAMIGFASDGTPLQKLLFASYPDTIAALTDALLQSTAAGVNPRVTARAMMDAMSGNLNRALTIARTEQLRSYREANRQQMIASGVVTGYIRRCALNPRTCMACIALDGEEYPTDELMNVHPNDLCFMQPKVVGFEPVQVTDGATWFQRQPEQVQRDMMGPKYYDAWQSGKFNLRDIATTHTDPIWGPTVGVTPLYKLQGAMP